MSPKAVAAGVWYWDEPYILGGTGAEGMAVSGDGTVLATDGLARFAAIPVS